MQSNQTKTLIKVTENSNQAQTSSTVVKQRRQSTVSECNSRAQNVEHNTRPMALQMLSKKFEINAIQINRTQRTT
ncbi:hypothetical protein PoB_000833500 [Plakobranchus ocellatus]|uniref:Uncharacterized protein n=1 Tax=Plakobranchus ocellatus TaxID=259542 RepID=A0AAV3YFI8_9GAST|nr:hypothetical protein PoB_000833500 [Plakobranchus ocellatus]